MQRPTALVFACLALFLVLSPLTLVKPGWPAGLKADEPAYYLMALSLAHDGDVRVELRDLRRLFDEFPDHEARNVILMTDDGWHTVYFGKPYLYSLAAAPLAGLFGANGLVAFNMALYLAMVAMGVLWLRRFNPEGESLLFAAGFFFLSAGFAYVFWIQPEIFNMAAIAACLYLGLTASPAAAAAGREPGRWRRLLAAPGPRVFAAGFVLLLAGYNKPMLVLMGLPVAWHLLAGRRLRHLGLFLAGGTVCLGLAALGALALTGHPSAYLGVARAGVDVCTPHQMPIEPLPPPPPVPAGAAPTVAPAAAERGSLADERRASWSWLLALPEVRPAELAEDVGYFLWGRHTGLFPYFPFSLLALVLFLVHGRRSGTSWVLLASLAVVALFFLLWIPFNWHGGGGFVGNRYFANVYPGFLFLVTRLRPRWLSLVGYAAGGLLLAPILFTPYGRTVAWPTLQAHVRNWPFPLLPLELTIKGIPGYHETNFAGARFRGRQDVFLPRGARAWVGGATTAELWIQTPGPVEDFHFEVASFATPNEIVLRLGEAREVLSFAAGETEPRRVVLRPGGPDRTPQRDGVPLTFYRLEVASRTGEVREWTRSYPPRDCFYFPWPESTQESTYVGAELSFLGSGERLALDLYAVEWLGVEAPARVAAGETFGVRTRVRNASAVPWPSDPPTRVDLSYHWLDADGREVVRNGLRTLPERAVAPGEVLDLEQTVEAPAAPGSYVLEVDLVYEGVSWFAQRNGGDVVRRPVEVVAKGI